MPALVAQLVNMHRLKWGPECALGGGSIPLVGDAFLFPMMTNLY